MRFTQLIVISLIFLQCSCTFIPWPTNTGKVIVSTKYPPSCCRYIGQVIRDRIVIDTWNYDPKLDEESNQELLIRQGAMTDLKLRAAAVGANYIQLRTSCMSAHSYYSCEGYKDSTHNPVYKINVANIWHCPMN